MVDFTAEFLKNAAVKVTAGFLTSGTPLSTGVATVAAESSLNNEQIKRLVEVVNQVAYLKLLSTAKDRTFEFPLAKYEEVLGIMMSPEIPDMTDTTPSPLSIVTGNSGLSKEASSTEHIYEPSEMEKVAYLTRHVYATRSRLEKIAEREVTLLDDIQRAVHMCRKDEEFMDKAAAATDGDEDALRKVAMLVFGEARTWSGDGLYYEEDLAQAKATVGLLKEASDLVEERKSLEATMLDLEKVASIPALGAMGARLGASMASAAKKVNTVGARTGAGLAAGLGAGGAALTAADSVMFAIDYKPKKGVWDSLQNTKPPVVKNQF